MEDKKKQALKFGVTVFIMLAVLTLGEYWVAIAGGQWWYILVGIALLKAWFVIQHYMHLPRLFNEEENH
ncbi:MAG: cytochrome C oxidase subunit IV family protein [Anaerolineae bacterium]|jgi:hypothetical protein|nr:cytochrome C oxidase subunit IV family protein [Anaerolineae bacterium]MBT7070344.1 cytochrome C oxidase subunit IV family protein [Anaerolineae bacterium]MBT7324386.1 cytochrome C oxidase subunit IV family protein [Anaerolineae bacterium]